MKQYMNKMKIKIATEEDVEVIFEFIKELADYEKLSHEVLATEEDIREGMFGERKVISALIAYSGEIPVGFALYFYNFSTFVGKPGIYLEDLYVKPEYRGSGYGKGLLVALAGIAKEEGCGRFEWTVLDWNKPSINFYESIGAKSKEEWIIYRMDKKAITELAEGN